MFTYLSLPLSLYIYTHTYIHNISYMHVFISIIIAERRRASRDPVVSRAYRACRTSRAICHASSLSLSVYIYI